MIDKEHPKYILDDKETASCFYSYAAPPVTVKRIYYYNPERAKYDIAGGWLQDYNNLSQEGNCKVYDEAKVVGIATVTDDALIVGHAIISDNASISGNAVVTENACIHGNAKIYGRARVMDYAQVTGDSRVYGCAWVYNNAYVSQDTEIYDFAKVYGATTVEGESKIYGNARIFDYAHIISSDVYDYAKIMDDSFIDSCHIGGRSFICGDTELHAENIRGTNIIEHGETIYSNPEVNIMNKSKDLPSEIIGRLVSVYDKYIAKWGELHRENFNNVSKIENVTTNNTDVDKILKEFKDKSRTISIGLDTEESDIISGYLDLLINEIEKSPAKAAEIIIDHLKAKAAEEALRIVEYEYDRDPLTEIRNV